MKAMKVLAAGDGRADRAAGGALPDGRRPNSRSKGVDIRPRRGVAPASAETSTRPERTRVFVYGTLLAGELNHRLVAGSRLVGFARTPPAFTLYDLGACPALVAHGRCAIEGEVYEVDEVTLAHLDQLEGHPRVYQRTNIRLEDGSLALAYLMPLVRVRGCPPIDSGSWRARQAAHGRLR